MSQNALFVFSYKNFSQRGAGSNARLKGYTSPQKVALYTQQEKSVRFFWGQNLINAGFFFTEFSSPYLLSSALTRASQTIIEREVNHD